MFIIKNEYLTSFSLLVKSPGLEKRRVNCASLNCSASFGPDLRLKRRLRGMLPPGDVKAPQKRLWLVEGVSVRSLVVYLFAVFFTVASYVFASLPFKKVLLSLLDGNATIANKIAYQMILLDQILNIACSNAWGVRSV